MSQQVDVLDYGFVRLVDFMGDDAAITQAARVSYGKGTKTARDDEALIRYLVRHRHTSPLEMVEFVFHCKLPIFVARQMVRHRTASLNEVSGRYSEMKCEFYVPFEDRIQTQSSKNKQGSSGQPVQDAHHLAREMRNETQAAYLQYDTYLYRGIARELARINLPLSTYTEWYWKIDLHNLLHFLKLRLDSHAQWEIQQYAQAIAKLIQPIVPTAYKAFEDYVLNAVTFSAQEMELIRPMMTAGGVEIEEWKQDCKRVNLSEREQEEFLVKTGIATK